MSSVWRVLFQLELDVDEARHRLGAFMCYQWPKEYARENGHSAMRAARVLLEAAGGDPDAAGLPDPKEIERFVVYAALRARCDNKASEPMILTLDAPMTREEMENLIDSADPKLLAQWRRAGKVIIPKVTIGEIPR